MVSLAWRSSSCSVAPSIYRIHWLIFHRGVFQLFQTYIHKNITKKVESGYSCIVCLPYMVCRILKTWLVGWIWWCIVVVLYLVLIIFEVVLLCLLLYGLILILMCPILFFYFGLVDARIIKNFIVIIYFLFIIMELLKLFIINTCNVDIIRLNMLQIFLLLVAQF